MGMQKTSSIKRKRKHSRQGKERKRIVRSLGSTPKFPIHQVAAPAEKKAANQ